MKLLKRCIMFRGFCAIVVWQICENFMAFKFALAKLVKTVLLFLHFFGRFMNILHFPMRFFMFSICFLANL